MLNKTIIISGSGMKNLNCKLWQPEGKIKAVLQITHGMTEHSGRYDTLAKELVQYGIAVATFDLRGHGCNKNSSCASFGNNGWQASLEDMHLLFEELNRLYGDVPHFMLGFSLGSFLLREYINLYNDKIAGAIIMGTGHQPGAILSMIIAIVNTQIKSAGFDNTTPLVKKLSFETYNKKFKPIRTESDWLCADEKELDKYISDDLCCDSISAGLFKQLLESMKRTGKKETYNNWNTDLPVLIISGLDDPVGDFGNGVKKVKSAMDDKGIKDLTIELLPGARHDILHEEASGNAQKSRLIISQWISERI